MIFDLTINGYPLACIPWNLFLMIIPFFLFFGIKGYWDRTRGKSLFDKIILAIMAIFWLLFLPNAAYVIIGIRHINGFCEVSQFNNCIDSSWIIMLFFTYAFFGWVGFVYSIKLMSDFLAGITRRLIANIFEIAIIPVISLGVLLGLIQRWNSWNILTNPGAIVSDAVMYFCYWPYAKNLLIYSLFLYILYYGGNLICRRIYK